jgi:hypothetical protein
MNYNRIKNIFISLYEELCETFDDFQSDFNEAINQEASMLQEARLYPKRNDIVKYFEKITESREAAETFIKELLAPSVKTRNKFDVSSSYHYVFAKETMVSYVLIGRDSTVNYKAFIKKLATEFNLYKKDIHELIKETNAIK